MRLKQAVFCLTVVVFTQPAFSWQQNPPAIVETADTTAQLVAPAELPANTDGGIQDRDKAEKPSTTPSSVELKYRFAPDQKLLYRTTEKKRLEGRLGENQKVDITEVRMTRVFTVQSVDPNGTAKIAMQFGDVWMSRQVNDQPPVVFDASMKPDDVPEEFRNVAHSLKGNATKYSVSDRGISADGAESRKTPATAAAVSQASLVETDGPASTAGQIQTASGTTTGRPERGTSILMLLPEKSVVPGDRWKEVIPVTVRVTQDIEREVRILRTYRLDAVRDGVAEISFWSSIESPVRGPMLMSQLIQATPRGTMRFDIQRGLMTRRELHYDQSVSSVFGPGSILVSQGTTVEELQPDQPR